MTTDIPYFREAGTGPGVICLHANASTSGQWRALTERLAPDYRVFAVDAYGAGKSPAWSADRPITLSDEVALLEPVFAMAGEPFVLVAHSYGAAVALIAALERPDRVRALAVYEPTLFGLVDAQSPPPNAVDGIRDTVEAAGRALDAGDRDRAAKLFIDFWAGEGSWADTPESRKAPIAQSVRDVRAWGHALLNEPTALAAFATLDIPVLYMIGKQSPPSSRSVASLLTRTLPRLEVIEFDGLGHMGPVTHPEPVNEAIARFLLRR